MLNQLDKAFAFNVAALGLREQRQQVLASNIANADTPNFKARDFDFSRALDGAMTTLAHGEAPESRAQARSSAASVVSRIAEEGLQYRVPTQVNIDGNTVDMDQERGAFADNAIRYEAMLTSTNSKIRTLLSAVQG